jgi:hypothetical protein
MTKKLINALKEDAWAYIILCFGFLLRLFYIFIFTKPGSYLWSDAGTYDTHALRMAKGIHIELSTYWPPFFHIFLSVIYRPLIWLGLENWRVNIDVLIFTFFYIISFWCIYQIVKKLFSKNIALIVLFVLILWYPFIFMNALIMSENLFLPLVFLGLYFLIVKPQTSLNGFWMGVFWGFAVILRPVFALSLPFFFFWAVYHKINWKFILNVTIAASIIIFSMMAFNFFYTGGKEKSISSSGGFNFAMSWCDTKSVKYYTEDGYWYWFASAANIDYPEDKTISTNVPFYNQKYYYDMGIDCIKKNPAIIINNLASIKKLFHSHLFPTTSDMAGWNFFRHLFKIILIILFFTSMLSIIISPKSARKYLYLFALIISALFITIYLQNVGEERYLIPYSPLLIIMSLPIFVKLYNYIFPIKFSGLDSIRPYWAWSIYFILIILTLFIFWLFSIKVQKAYLVSDSGLKTQISLPFQTDQDHKNISYEIIIDSNINQSAKINIVFDDIINKISINNNEVDLADFMKKNDQFNLDDWDHGYVFDIPLKMGKNILKVDGKNTGWGYSLKIKQKPFFWIWISFFISVGLPLAHVIIIIFEILFKKRNGPILYDRKK